MDKKVIAIFVLAILVCGGVFFLGRSCSNRPTVDTNSELYNDAITEIGKLRTELGEYSKLVEGLKPGLESLTVAINSSQVGLSASIEISEDIESGSGEIGDIARELNADITEIREASLGLAEIFGVSTEEN